MNHCCEAVRGREVLELTKQKSVFIQRRFAKSARLGIGNNLSHASFTVIGWASPPFCLPLPTFGQTDVLLARRES
jgi:hypothetical protein